MLGQGSDLLYRISLLAKIVNYTNNTLCMPTTPNDAFCSSTPAAANSQLLLCGMEAYSGAESRIIQCAASQQAN